MVKKQSRKAKESSALPHSTVRLDDFVRSVREAVRLSPRSVQPAHNTPFLGCRYPLILVGREALRLERIANWLLEQTRTVIPELEVNRYQGSQLSNLSSAQLLRADIGHAPLFQTLRFIIIAEADKAKSAATEAILQSMQSAQHSALLMLLCENISQRSPLPWGLREKATIVEVPELSTAELRQWVEKEATRCGAPGSVAPDVAQLLVETFGNDLHALSQEIGKISLSLPAGSKITSAGAKALLAQRPEQSSFELWQAIAQRNVAKSLLLQGRLIEQGFHPLQLASFFSRCVRMLISRIVPLEGQEKLPDDLGNPWFARQIGPTLRLFQPDDLRAALKLLTKLDLDLKGSPLKPNLLLALTVQRLALRTFAA